MLEAVTQLDFGGFSAEGTVPPVCQGQDTTGRDLATFAAVLNEVRISG